MSKSNLTAWERWEMASFDSVESSRAKNRPPAPPVPAAPEEEVIAVKLPTAEEVEAIMQQAREQGYQAGHAEGYVAGHTAGKEATMAEATLLAQAVSTLDASLNALDEQISQEILLLALEVAKQVVRISITQQPESLLTVISEALALLPHQYANIYLHPDDAALVRNQQGSQLTHAGHRIHEDATLQRGDCVLESGNSRVDATLGTRWRRVVAALGSDMTLETAEDHREEP